MIVASNIRQLVNELCTSLEADDIDTQVQVCSLMCNLLHMRAGIVNAFLALDIISLLFDVLKSQYEHCRRTSAIALSYITYNAKGSRQVLKYCRKAPKLYKRLSTYSKGYPLHPDFVENWEHFESTHLRGKAARMKALRENAPSPRVVAAAYIGASVFRSSRMDHRNISRLSSHKGDEEEEEHEDPPSTKMGFYETVASEHASTINRRAFRVSTDKPGPRNNALELVQAEESTSGRTFQREMRMGQSEGLKLPPITSTSVIANSAS